MILYRLRSDLERLKARVIASAGQNTLRAAAGGNDEQQISDENTHLGKCEILE